MPTKPLERLLFKQGSLCFFCKQPLSRSEASVEHLLAKANGGANEDENCVACCKSVNTLLGSLSLKEKVQVVLNQKGAFKCPNDTKSAPAHVKKVAPAQAVESGNYGKVVANLRKRGHSKPNTLKTLRSSIASLLPKGHADSEVGAIIDRMKAERSLVVAGTKVSYALK